MTRRLARVAAADGSSERSLDPVMHRLEVEGEALDIVCHRKARTLVRLSIVDRASRDTSVYLDRAWVILPSGRTLAIGEGGAEVGLEDLLAGIAFSINLPDGRELRVCEP